QGIGGGAEGDRTPDLRIANATLSQLSYGPTASVTPPWDGGGLWCSLSGVSSGPRSTARSPPCGPLRLKVRSARHSPPRSSFKMYAFLRLVHAVISIYIWL